jgi:SAM-dependent methyltransferase
MRPSQGLYSALAASYREHFDVPHRRAYDTLAWELVRQWLPEHGPIADAGCGVGRWAQRLLALGYDVIGIESAPGMIAELRRADYGAGFTLIDGSMETADLPAASVGMVLAMGSLQYTTAPEATLRRFARWVRPAGLVVVLVDSLVGLVIELLRDGRYTEALERLRTRTGIWAAAGETAEMHLMDRDRLCRAFVDAGLRDVRVTGLLTTAPPIERGRLAESLRRDWDGHLSIERQLQADPALADIGKHLLAVGRRPGGVPAGDVGRRPEAAPAGDVGRHHAGTR